jgi:hypothetical protein
LDNLLTQLASKRQRLMGMRRESNQRMADFAVADVSLFWLLNALNTYQPVLADFKASPARHPEQVYQELVKLAGALLTFSLEHDVDAIPAYRHEDLETVFPPLMQMISTLLEASLPSRVIALALERVIPGRWQVTFNDPRLREADAADFYLSVRCREAPAQLQAGAQKPGYGLRCQRQSQPQQKGKCQRKAELNRKPASQDRCGDDENSFGSMIHGKTSFLQKQILAFSKLYATMFRRNQGESGEVNFTPQGGPQCPPLPNTTSWRHPLCPRFS